MHHEILRRINYFLNQTFVLGVLVLIPHSGESPSLFLRFAIMPVLICSKNYIIIMIVNNFSVALLVHPLLKMLFTHHCLVFTEKNLIFNPN